MKLNSCEKKVLRKLKTQNLNIKTLIKILHLLGAYIWGGGLKFQFSTCPCSSSSDASLKF